MHPEKAARLYEQYELFPEMSAKKRRDDALHVLLYAVGLIVLLSGIAFADEPPRFIAKGMICDEIEQVIESMENVQRSSKEIPLADGCGFIQRPVYAIIEPLHSFESRYASFRIIKLDLGPLGIQYGYDGFTLKPEERGS